MLFFLSLLIYRSCVQHEFIINLLVIMHGSQLQIPEDCVVLTGTDAFLQAEVSSYCSCASLGHWMWERQCAAARAWDYSGMRLRGSHMQCGVELCRIHPRPLCLLCGMFLMASLCSSPYPPSLSSNSRSLYITSCLSEIYYCLEAHYKAVAW